MSFAMAIVSWTVPSGCSAASSSAAINALGYVSASGPSHGSQESSAGCGPATPLENAFASAFACCRAMGRSKIFFFGLSPFFRHSSPLMVFRAASSLSSKSKSDSLGNGSP